MTNKKDINRAIDILIKERSAEQINPCGSVRKIRALSFAIKALEKQIPKKPKYSGNTAQDTAYCPVCGFEFETLENITYYNISPAFCENCGQALDWSEEE